MAARAAVGDRRLVPVCAATRGVCGAWRGGGAPAVERRQAAADHGPDGVFGSLGAPAELARGGGSVPGELGGRVSFGGMAGGLGPGASRTARPCSRSAWTKYTGGVACGRVISSRSFIR